MSRIFWDAMLFIYLLDGKDARADRVTRLLWRSRERGDKLLTSRLALGEVMAGAGRALRVEPAQEIRRTIDEMGLSMCRSMRLGWRRSAGCARYIG